VKYLVLAVTLILYQSVASAISFYELDIDRFCAKVVEIPYASDNFSEEKWKEFQECRNNFIEVRNDY
jgi:hypothetical protein